MQTTKTPLVTASFIVSAFALLVPLLYSTGAAAHVLKENNGIKAILHIVPDDEPKANETTKLSVLFGDETGAFNLQDCICRITVQKDGQAVQSTLLKPTAAGESLDSSANIVFPAISVYDVIVSGTSKTDAFPDFSLDYPVRVATAVPKKANNQGTLLILAVAGGTLVVGLAVWLSGHVRKHTTKKRKR